MFIAKFSKLLISRTKYLFNWHFEQKVCKIGITLKLYTIFVKNGCSFFEEQK